MKKQILTTSVLLALNVIQVDAQEEQVEKDHTINFSAYTNAYYSYFTNEMEANDLQPYTTVSPRSKRFGLNVGQVGISYNSERVRGNITLHWGDIAEATWSPEFTNVQEANIGVRLTKNWWLDTGFFTTHIGTESFLPKNNLLSSTAVATYNEPFYQSGARLSYEGSNKFYVELWAVNGYNYFLDANDAKSFGVLLSYKFNENTSLTYTNLLGRESLDDAPASQFRTYHNLYMNTSFGANVIFILGGDFGTQSNSKTPDYSETAIMYNALATLRYQFSDQWSVTGRGEIFRDESGFVSGILPARNNEIKGLHLWGLTLGSEYRPADNAYVRAEARFLEVDENTLLFSSDYSENKRWEVMLTMGLQLGKLFIL
jgi:hypothetical protein